MREITPGPNVLQQGRESDFGQPIKTWDVWSKRAHLQGLIGTVVLAALAALFYYLGVVMGKGKALYLFLAVLAAAMAFGVLVRLATFVWAMIRTGRRVTLFERGLIEAREDRIKQLVSFKNADQYEEKTRIYKNGVDMGIELKLTIHNQDGSSWTLDGPADFVSASGEAIAGQQAAYRFAEIFQAITDGQQVPFGTLTLTPQGVVTAAGQTVPYESITGWTTDKGDWTMTYDHQNPRSISGSVNKTINYRALRANLVLLAPQLRELTQ